MGQLNYFKMKNVFFALAFMLVGTFAFANTVVTSEIGKDLEKAEQLQYQNIFNFSNEKESLETGFAFKQKTSELNTNEILNNQESLIPCCWRDCVIIGGVKYCTDWTCGECVIIIF